MSNEKRTFDDMLYDAFDLMAKQESEKMNEEMKGQEITFSNDFKIKMNRLFREQAGIEKVPHPEVDTNYERCRSYIVRKWLVIINHFEKAMSNMFYSKRKAG